MKKAGFIIVLTIVITGCATQPVTKFDCGQIQLALKGSVRTISEVSAVEREEGLYYCLDSSPKQVNIEARFVEVRNRDLSLLGINWLTADGKLIDPDIAKNTTPPPPSISFGVGFGIGGGGGGGRSDCPAERHHSGGGSSFGTGMGFNIPLSSSNRITSIETVFNLPGNIQLDSSYIVLQVQEKIQQEKLIVRPVILPIHTIPKPKPKDQPIEVPPTTFVTLLNGNEISIGGLKIPETEATSKVPLLNDLPMIGNLFKNSDKVRRSETIIFITPRLLLTEE